MFKKEQGFRTAKPNKMLKASFNTSLMNSFVDYPSTRWMALRVN